MKQSVFRNRTIKSRLFRKAIVTYFILAIIPTVLVTVAAALIFTNGQQEQNMQMVERYAGQNETIVQERMDLYKDVFYRLIADKDFIQNAQTFSEQKGLPGGPLQMQISDQMQTYISTYRNIRGAAYIADSSAVVSCSKWYGSSSEMSWSDPAVSRRILTTVTDSRNLTFLTMEELNRYHQGKRDYVILMAMPVRNLVTKERSGVLVFALSDKILLFDDTSETDYFHTVITDGDDQIMAGAQDEYINRPLQAYLEVAVPGRWRTLYEHAITDTDWKIVNILDQKLLLKDTIRFIVLVIVLMVAISGTLFIVTFRFLRNYIGDILAIAAGIDSFNAESGNPIRIETLHDDDLDIIVRRFNEAADRTAALVAALKERNELIRLSESNRRHAEIKALEAQINPHFLYNTLDSINWRAIDHGEEEISNMLGMLGSLLRYSISNIDCIVLLRAEIEWLKKYVYLQKERFHDSFDCIYEISEEALDFPVYKMLLQPLVENSILHAFEEKKEGGLIRVRAEILPDGRLEIQIEDNGCGMDAQTLERLQSEISGTEDMDSRSIGIRNVANRLKIYYQGEAEFILSGEEGRGVCSIIRIPGYETGGKSQDEDYTYSRG